MDKIFKLIIIIAFIALSLNAESNKSIKTVSEKNSTMTRAEKSKKHIEEQIAREKKFAKEQKFYQDKDYNLSSHEVDLDSLKSIPVIEPEYDFSMDHVYD